ncbi:MAG: electron transfer flavoprotein subunit beta/FixA family protein [Bacillota bacterium]
MKAFVCLSVSFSTWNILWSMGALDTSEAQRELPVMDRSALALAKQAGAEEIIALGWVPATDESVFRQGLAFGANRAVRIAQPLDEATATDPLVVASGLAEAIRKLAGADSAPPGAAGEPAKAEPAKAEPAKVLVFCGEASAEFGRGAVGPMLAESLGIPVVTGARALEAAGGALTVQAWEDDKVATYKLDGPAVVTVGPSAPAPGKPNMMAAAKAMRAPIETVDIEPRPASLRPRGVTSNEQRRRGKEPVAGSNLAETVQVLFGRLRERRVV